MKSKSQLQDITNNKRPMDIQIVLSLFLSDAHFEISVSALTER